jgi:hypothetical protein
MVNSSWTEEHINDLWLCSLKTHCVYPPCDVEELKQMPQLSEGSSSQNGKEVIYHVLQAMEEVMFKHNI